MDIIKAFQKNEIGINITIKGTHESPLFKANDIAQILDINNIRQNIQDFDITEKDVCLTDTLGGSQEITYLTEKGLYKILFRSRKPIAKQFTDWVCEVIKEIRLKGIYNLQEQLTEKEKNIGDIKTDNQNNILLNFENKHVVYTIQVEENIIKFGYAKDIKTRFSQHKLEFGKDIKILFIFETVSNREFENMIKHDEIIKKYIFEKTYKTNQTELIKLDNIFTIKHLTDRLNELKRNINNDTIINITKERDNAIIECEKLKNEIIRIKSELEEKQEELDKINKQNQILIKKGYVEKDQYNSKCARCNQTKDNEEFNVNSVSNRPKSICKICEEFNLEKYEIQNRARIEQEKKEQEEKDEKIKQIRLKLLESKELIKCTRCNKNKTAKEIGVNIRSNDYYKICEICRNEQLPKNSNIIQGKLPDSGETQCSKCKNNFPTTLNKISRINYKTCEICREKDKILSKKDKDILKTEGISTCIYCKDSFEPELTKKKDGYLKSCKNCRDIRKTYDKKRNKVHKEDISIKKKEYYHENKRIIREKQNNDYYK